MREIIRDLSPTLADTSHVQRQSFAPGPVGSMSDKPIADRPAFSIDVNVLLKRLDFDIRVTPQLWVCWCLLDVLAFGSLADLSFVSSGLVESGLQFGSQSLRFVPTTASQNELPAVHISTMMVKVPAIQASAKYFRPRHQSDSDTTSDQTLELLVTLDFIDVVLQPEVLDSLFAVIGQIGRDITELVDLLVDARKAHVRSRSSSVALSSESDTAPPSEPSTLRCSTRFALRGFKVGLQGASSTQYFEAALLQGRLSSPLVVGQEMAWSFDVSELALSLDHTPVGRKSTLPASSSEQQKLHRKYRSAILTVDIAAQNHPFDATGPTRKPTTGKNELRHLHVRLDRVHAVVEAAAVGQLGDLIEQYSDELGQRRKHRAVELEELRSSTQRVWETDDPVAGERLAEPATLSWLDDRLVSLRVNSVGFAFPLARQDGDTTSVLASVRPTVPAFLFSIETVDFSTQRYETGKASIQDAAAQFVPRLVNTVHAFRLVSSTLFG